MEVSFPIFQMIKTNFKKFQCIYYSLLSILYEESDRIYTKVACDSCSKKEEVIHTSNCFTFDSLFKK